MGRNDSKRAGQSTLERSGVKYKVIQCNQIRLHCITFYMCVCLLVFILLNLPPSSAPMRHCSHENGARKPDADVDTGGSRCDRSEGTSLNRRRRQGTPLCCSARTWSINPECDSGIPLLAANFYPESHSELPLARLNYHVFCNFSKYPKKSVQREKITLKEMEMRNLNIFSFAVCQYDFFCRGGASKTPFGILLYFII